MSNKRRVVFTEGEIYHIYNRSVGKIEIMNRKKELQRAFELLDYYRFPQKIKFSQFKKLPLEDKEKYRKAFINQKSYIEIYSFALMPDHYHLLLSQREKNGIRVFISNFQNAFAKYFNAKNERDGSVFKNPFQAKWIENDKIFAHISRYIHLNPVTSHIIEIDALSTYPWTSYPFYLGKIQSNFVDTGFLLKMFGHPNKYKKFVEDRVDYQRKLYLIKKAILE